MDYLTEDKEIQVKNTSNNYYSYTFNKHKEKENKVVYQIFHKHLQQKYKKPKKKVKNRKVRKYKNRIPRSYKLYIKSSFWENRKNRYWQKYKKVCCVCGSYEMVSLHHGKYENKSFSNEPDSWLFPLCQLHHSEFHEMYPMAKDMLKETNEYISDNYIPHDNGNL